MVCRRCRNWGYSEAFGNVTIEMCFQVSLCHLADKLTLQTLCARSGETLRAGKEPILGTDDAHSAHM